jgi:hypothetical protein
MSSLLHRRSVSRRGAVLFAFALAAASTIAARAPAPGMTYRVRVVVTPPDIPGMPPQSQTVIVGHGASIGMQSRLDIDSVQGQMPLAIGDFMLSLDSGRVVMVSPSTKTFSEGMPAMAAMPPEVIAQASVTNVNVTTEKLGAGETMQGFATEKVRMTVTYSLSIMGTMLNTMTTSDMWIAQLPAAATTPFDGALPKELSEGPMKELADKTMAARKTIKGTPLKTVTTSMITGPATFSTVTTVDLLDLKTGDVDPAVLKVPDGFTRKP